MAGNHSSYLSLLFLYVNRSLLASLRSKVSMVCAVILFQMLGIVLWLHGHIIFNKCDTIVGKLRPAKEIVHITSLGKIYN